MLFSSREHNYPEDIFDNSRMSFGEHLEELRSRLLKAIKWLLFFLVFGFVLDWTMDQLGYPEIGIGRPMMKVIIDPVEKQAASFYHKRARQSEKNFPTGPTDPATIDEINKILDENEGDLSALSSDQKKKLRGAPRPMPVILPVEPLAKAFGIQPKDPTVTEIELTMRVYPAYLSIYGTEGETIMESRRYLTTLSAPEAFMVYFKVSLLCGVILASPFIFYHIWAFIAAGLYPHEKKYVHKFLPYSLGLFLAGVFLCQFVVLPGAVKALLGFNAWIDSDPDLRLNEWLSFAIVLPLVFGISFQTPLVMYFLNRIGIFGWEDYWSKWRYAMMILAIFAAVITPTPDAVTMMYLFVPMFGLYCLGVLVCKFFPPPHEVEEPEEQEIAV